MITLTKWIDRKFCFDFPVGLMPTILTRLRGTPVRLADLIAKVPDSVLSQRPSNGWSIKEHIGHIADIEVLHDNRLNQYDASVEVLQMADMSNTRTRQSDHNQRSAEQLMIRLRQVRQAFLKRLEAMDQTAASRTAHHPRLEVPMRVVDMALFAAEHDDQHLAAISALLPG